MVQNSLSSETTGERVKCLQNLIRGIGSHRTTGRARREKVREGHHLFTTMVNLWKFKYDFCSPGQELKNLPVTEKIVKYSISFPLYLIFCAVPWGHRTVRRYVHHFGVKKEKSHMKLSSLLISVPWFSRRMQVSFLQLPRWVTPSAWGLQQLWEAEYLINWWWTPSIKKKHNFFVLSHLDFRVNLLLESSLGLLAKEDTCSHNYL